MPQTHRGVFGWIKSAAGLAKVKVRARTRVDIAFIRALAAYNHIRLPKLLETRRSGVRVTQSTFRLSRNIS